MLTAIQFVRQADGKVGKWFARHVSSLNAFNKIIITDGADPDVISDLSEKFGTLILPIQHYAASGSVYHMLKGPFAEYMQDGIVGSELASAPRAPRAPRSPRAPRESAPMPVPAPAKASPARIALAARHTSRFAARALVVSARAQEVRNGIADPDIAILTLARNFRDSGKTALAQALEADYLVDFDAAQKARLEVRATELSEIMAALVKEYGFSAVETAAADAVAAAASK